MNELGSVSVWVRQLPQGEQEAQQQILDRYQTQLVAYAAARLRQIGVHHTEADDIAQEVFVGLFRRAAAGKMPDLIDREKLWLKLRQICGDRVKDARRKRTPLTESVFGSSDEEQGVSPLEVKPGAPAELDSCLVAVEHALLRRALAEEHPDLPEIVSLRIAGYRVREIAKQLDGSKATVERRLRAIDRICSQYQEMP